MGDLKDFLAKARKPLVFAGVGNKELSDDGAGPALAGMISNPLFATLDCGNVPENFLEKIAALKAATIVIIDATDLRTTPGSYTLLPAHQIAHATISTHALSLGMMAHYLSTGGTSELYLLGVQPQTISEGACLSEPVGKTIGELATIINTYHER
jgi:hydrogenase maturation protease